VAHRHEPVRSLKSSSKGLLDVTGIKDCKTKRWTKGPQIVGMRCLRLSEIANHPMRFETCFEAAISKQHANVGRSVSDFPSHIFFGCLFVMFFFLFLSGCMYVRVHVVLNAYVCLCKRYEHATIAWTCAL
jgi:hypothetical protein